MTISTSYLHHIPFYPRLLRKHTRNSPWISLAGLLNHADVHRRHVESLTSKNNQDIVRVRADSTDYNSVDSSLASESQSAKILYLKFLSLLLWDSYNLRQVSSAITFDTEAIRSILPKAL